MIDTIPVALDEELEAALASGTMSGPLVEAVVVELRQLRHLCATSIYAEDPLTMSGTLIDMVMSELEPIHRADTQASTLASMRLRDFIAKTLSSDLSLHDFVGIVVREQLRLNKESTGGTRMALTPKQEDSVYSERDMLLCAFVKVISAVGVKCGLAHHNQNVDENKIEPWDPEWLNVVFVELPNGQCSWHIHDSELPWFDFLTLDPTWKWDGHSTVVKYTRLAVMNVKDIALESVDKLLKRLST